MSRRAAIAVAGVDRELFSIDPSDPGSAATLVQAQLGQLVRTDLDGEGEAIWSSASVTTDIMLSQDVKYVASATTMVTGDASSVTLTFGVAITPIAGGETRFVELAPATLDALLAPASIALMP